MINNYTNLSSGSRTWLKRQTPDVVGNAPNTDGLFKRFWVLSLIILSVFTGFSSYAQVNYSQNFNTDAGSFTGGFTRFTGATACGGSGGAMRRNLYSGVTTGELISPNTGTANGTSAQIITYDYKAATWSANTSGTNPWGSFVVQYGSSAAGPWTTIATVSQETQNGSCISKSHTFTPPAGSLFIRFSATWSSGDYYLNFDNIAVTLAPTTPPSCTTGLLPATGATQIARNPALSWNNLLGVTGYKVYFGTSPSPGLAATVSGSSYSPPVLAANTTYYWKVVPTNDNGDAVDCVEQSFTTGSGFTYCSAVPTSMDNNGITNVQFETFSNPNVSPLTYQDFRALTPATLLRTLTVPITVSLATGYTYNVRVFIDYNQDGDFNDANENNLIGLSSNANPTSISGNLIIPADAVLGNTVMRIVATDNDTSNDPCYSSSYGNVEDYTVNIAQPVLCENTPNAGVASISQSTGCAGGSLSLSATGVSGGALGLSYKWQSSPDDVVWTDIPTATNLNFTVPTSTAGTTYYRLFTSCSYSGLSNFSNSVSFNGLSCGSNIVPASGNTLVDCGTNTFIYDNGGSSADYANNTNGYLVLDNSGTGVITLSGSVLGMESCCDDIYIYSGVGTGGTLLANYTTAGAITPIVSAPGQPITIQFTSDVSAVGPGFAFQAVYTGTCLTCTIPVAGTASAATATYCNSGATTIAATGYSEGTGTRYQWESSTDNFATAGVAIGSVANSYSSLSTGTITTTTSYRLKVFCIANPGDVSYSSVATVTINFPGTIAPITGAGICAGQSATLTAVSAGALSFDWTASGGYTNTGSSITVSPAVTTTYTVTATYANNCTATENGTVTIIDTPSAITVTPVGLTNSTICSGSNLRLNATGGNYNSTFFSDNFDAASAQFTAATLSGTSDTTAALNTTYQSQGSGSVLFNTTGTNAAATYSLNSNVNLVGATAATLTFSHIASMEGNFTAYDFGYVEYSSDGGATWTTFTSTNYTGGANTTYFSGSDVRFSTLSYADWNATLSGTNAPNNSLWKTETFSIPAAALTNQFKIRFRYTTDVSANWLGWFIDNVNISANGNVQYSWAATPTTPLFTDAALTNVYNPATDFAATVYAQPNTATQFTVNVSSGSCSNSGSTTVNVNELPSFSVNPITICEGTTGTLTAVSAGSNSYSWTPVGGGTTLTGTSVMVSPSETTTYNVTATSNTTVPACSSTQQVTVTVNEPGTIVSGTASRTVSPGQLTTFEVVTTGLVTYQWQLNDNVNGWQNILAANPDYSGENTAVLSVQNITLGFDTYQYRCLVTGLAPCATLTPIEAILNVTNTGFLTQPADVNLCGASSTSFSIVTTGDEPYNVQWQMSTDGGASFNDIFDGPDASGLTFSGANEFSPKTLFVSGITTDHDGYQFKCQLDFFLDSGIATLTVNTPVSLTNNFSTTPVVRCSTPSAAATSFGISTSGSVEDVEWKYATSASGPWNTIAAGTPVGASYSGAGSNTLSVTTTAATPVGNYYYKAFVTGAGSGADKCADAESAIATISVVNPTITVSPSSTVYCTPGPAVTLTAGGSDINNYTWTASGFTTTTGTSIAVTPSAATTYTVTGTNSNGCTNTAQATVTVGGAFTASASASAATVCPGTPVTLTGTSALINLVPTPMPVGSYTFESTTATYSSIVGGVGTTAVSLSSMDDSISATQTLPFTFNFGGNNFTTFKINSNGWIQLGATSTSTTNYSSLSGSDNNIIAAFSRDLDGNNTTSTSYYVQTSGAVGSRITKIQWTNIRSFSSTASPATGNVQIWLYEGTNRVEIRYGDFTVTSARTSTGITCQVGLRGASSAAANVKSLSNTGSWATPTVGTSSSSTVALGNFASPILPDNGRVYRFSPLGNGTSTYTYAWSSVPAGFTANTAVATVNPSVNSTYNVVVTSSTGCTATASTSVVVDSTPPVITSSPVATQQLCQGTTATFTVAATSATALTYQWFKDGSPLVNGSGISGVTTATLTITGTTPASSGSYTVAVTNCSTVTSGASVLTVYPTPTAVAPAAQTYCIDAVVPATPLTGTPSGVTFNISGGAALGLPNQTGVTQIPSFTPTASGTATISITPVANGCSGTAVTYILKINPLPAAPAISSNSPICQGSTLDFASTVALQQGYSLNSNSNVPFIDINATGVSVGTLGDDTEHNITIPTFTFNGTPYTTARIGNNGLIVFGSTSGDVTFSNATLPSTANTAGNTFLAPFWDDLDIQTGATCKTQTVGNLHIIQFTTMAHDAFTTGSITFQVQLNLTTGVINFVYQDVIFGSSTYDSGASATIGVQYDSTSALQYSSNTASLINGQSLTFTPAAYSYAWSGPNGFTSALPNPSIANATPAATGDYTLEITNMNGCKSSSTIAAVVHPTPTVVAPANQTYYTGFATAAIPLVGTPSNVTFNISGGAASGLADVNGVTAIPSFIPTAIPSTVTITPVANGCTGVPVTFQISFVPVVVNIESNVCGSINNGLNNQINCTNISIPGYTTTGYQFEVTNMSTGEVSIVFSSQHHFKLTDASNYSYGTTFSIRVAVVLDGNVQGYYGSTCSLTTTEVRTTKVITSQCGATLVFINSTINANTVSSTNLYRFRVALASAPTVTYLVERTVPNFKLTDVIGLPIQFDTEYLVDVQVRVKLAGFEAWSQYGERCSVFTPEAPISSLVDAQCEDFQVTSDTQLINAISFPGATAYRFKLTGYDEFGDVNYTQIVTSTLPYFTLSMFTGLTPGTTYTVGVSLELFGVYTEYGKDCTIITPVPARQASTTVVEPFKATAYPNPFAANFMIDVKTSSTSVIAIKVYDMVGRLVEQRTATVTELDKAPIGTNYPSGVYNVVVTQDETVQTVRVVKR